MSATSALRDSILICAAWISLKGPVLSSSDPMYLLPFSNLTFAYDVMEGENGDYPDTWTCPEFEAGHPDFDYGALVFKGHETYVEFEMEEQKLDSITFSFFMYPYNTTGVILDYTADVGSKDSIHAWTIELENGFVKSTVKNASNGILLVMSSTDHIALGAWNFIAASKHEQTYSLQVNWFNHDQTVDSPKLKFDAKGELDIARNSSSKRTPFKGRLSCLSIWDDSLPHPPSEITKWCHKNEWPEKPLNPTPRCTPTVPPVTARVTHLWPLSLSSNGCEVVNNVQPTTSAPFQCFFTSRVTYPATNRSVVYLDGSAISYLDAVIPAINVTNDVTVAIAVRPDHLVEGVIWDIQMPSLPGTDQGWGIRLSLTNEYAVFAILNATDICGTVTSRYRIHGNEWSFISTMLVLTNNTMNILSNNALESTAINCRPNFAANRSGSIRIGQALDPQLSTVGYHGSVACLAVVGGVVGRNIIQELVENHCKDMDKQNSSVVKENCSAKQGFKVKGTRFRMTASDMCPAPEWFPLSTSRSVMSLLKCSTDCTTLSECRSFAFNTTSSTDNCRVYHFVTRSGLLADEGCNYYSVARD